VDCFGLQWHFPHN